MDDRTQPVKPIPLSGLGSAGVILLLTLGTLVTVALSADQPRGLMRADWAAIRFTLLQAILSAAFSVALAIPVARALARRTFPGRGLFLLVLGAPFILPVIVAVLGLVSVYGRSGIVSQVLTALGLPPLNIYGLSGVVLAHVFFNLPLATRLILQGWQSIPAERFRLSAQLGFSPSDMRRHLEGPMLRQVLPGAFATIFLLCLTSFAVALTLGGGPRATTVELAIYQAFRYDFDLARAALLALVQFLICAIAAFIAWKVTQPMGVGRGLDQRVERWDSQGRGTRVADAALLVIVLFFLAPSLLMVAVRGVAGLGHIEAPVLLAALRSLIVACGSAALTLALALSLARSVVLLEQGRGRVAAAFEGLGYLSLAASPMVIGTGLFIALFPFMDPSLIALPMTALVNAAMSLPFALRSLIPAVRNCERDYGALADSLGLVGLNRFRRLTWPRIRREAGFATGLAAALSMGDLGVIALFADPDAATLPMMLFRLMGAYRMDAAYGAALLLVALSLLLFWIFDRGGAQMLDLRNLIIRQNGFELSVNWTLEKGARLALIGPSGAGKTTLLSTIAGFLRPTSGGIFFEGQEITDTPPMARPFSLLFQDNNLFPHMSLRDNIALGIRPDLKLNTDQNAAVERVLSRVGLGGMGGRKPGQLSGGQRQRGALARALIRNKPVLLLDEPFAALGPAMKSELLDLVAEILDETGASLIMVTHDPADARRLARLTSIVSDGMASAPRSTSELFAAPPKALADYLGN